MAVMQEVFGVSSILCFLIGTLGNILAVSYFTTRANNTSANTLLYSFINITDIFISTLILFVGLGNLQPALGSALFSQPVFCNVWGVLWNITIRLSVFLIAVLSISRTLSVAQPLRPLRSNRVLLPILLYVVLMFLQSCMPFMYDAVYHYLPHYVFCAWQLTDIFPRGEPVLYFWLFVLTIVEFAAPLFPVTGCCVYLVYKLNTRASVSERVNAIKRSATVTIVQLTVAYLVFNIPLCVVVILNYITLVTGSKHPDHYHFNYNEDLRSFINVHTIALNSTVNTCLYFYRIKELRVWSLNLLSACQGRLIQALPARNKHNNPAQGLHLDLRASRSDSYMEQETFANTPLPATRKIVIGVVPEDFST